MVRYLYLDYKGELVERIANGINTENGLSSVVYKDGNNKIWITPYDKFYGFVKIDGKEVERFKFLGRF